MSQDGVHLMVDLGSLGGVLAENKFSSQGDVPPDFFCHSCLEVSKKVERFLADPSLNDEVDTLSNEICHILHPDLQVKCMKIMELYLREGILFLQILFLEKNICNSTGFCPNNNRSSTPTSGDNGQIKSSTPFKAREWKRCETCHVAAEQIRKGLEDHEQQIKVIKTLLDACELVQTYADKCKRLVFQYGPLGLANLQKFLSSTDFCHLIHLCEEAKPPKGKTREDY
ncbi:hypothetical protein Taro_037527 [Colocasia esculenta]|uniref:Saposin B-type domain-containing protein n=1 Tax=Colocasia esculenta TaxID=4460 RepID=A0A843WL25_COLES|nr:hypothetical protein [Colocasia esculenta]